MADLAKIATAEPITITDGVSQQVAVSTSSPPSSSAVGLIVREAAQGQQTMANSQPVVIASNQSNLPINIAQVSGSTVSTAGTGIIKVGISDSAGTSITLGQTTMSASVPVAIASNQSSIQVVGAAASGATASGNPVQVGGVFNTTQPTVTTGQAVSFQATARGAQIVATGVDTFTVTANAGTGNFGVNLTQIAGSSVSTAATGIIKVGLTDSAGTSITLGQTTMSASVPVAIASNQSAIQVVGAAASGATASGNPVQMGGVFNTTQPTVTTGQAVSLQATARGALIVATGVDNLNVNQATASNLNAQVVGNVASGASDSGNPVKIGGVATVGTNPTAVTNGQRTNIMTDDVGRLVVVNSHVRDMIVKGVLNLTTTTTTNLFAAAGAGIFVDITNLYISTDGNTVVNVTISDGTVSAVFVLGRNTTGPNAPVVINFSPPWPATTANTAWTATCSAAVSTVRIFALGVKNV